MSENQTIKNQVVENQIIENKVDTQTVVKEVEKQVDKHKFDSLLVESKQLFENKQSENNRVFKNTQEDLVYSGQRKINLIWEFTQAFIAVVVVVTNMVGGIIAIISAIQGTPIEIPVVMVASLFLVVGFYFSRTNHQAIGGVGKKVDAEQEYRGR